MLNKDEIMTIEEFATIINRKPITIKKWLQQKLLPNRKFANKLYFLPNDIQTAKRLRQKRVNDN